MSLTRDNKDGLTKWASEIARFITNPGNRDEYPAYAISKEKDGDGSIAYGYPASKHEWRILVNEPYGSNLAYSEDRFNLTSGGLQLAVCDALLKYLHAFNDSDEATSLYCSLRSSGVLYCISVSAREAEKIQLLTESYRIDQEMKFTSKFVKKLEATFAELARTGSLTARVSAVMGEVDSINDCYGESIGHEWESIGVDDLGTEFKFRDSDFQRLNVGVFKPVASKIVKHLLKAYASGIAVHVYLVRQEWPNHKIDYYVQILNADEYACIKQRVEKKYMEDNSFLAFLTDCDLEQSDLGSIILSGIQMRDPQFYPTVRKSYELRARESDALAIKYLFQVLQVKGVNCTLADFRQLK